MADKKKISQIQSSDFQILPEQQSQQLELRKIRQSGNWKYALAILILVGGVYGWLIYQRNKLQNSIAQIDAGLLAVESSRNRELERGLLLFQRRISTVSRILESHTYSSAYMDRLHQQLKPEVVLDDFSLDVEARSVRFSLTAPSYYVAAQQIHIFEADEEIQGIKVGSLDADEKSGVISFSLEIVYSSPNVFKRQSNG